jgi:hypothetical protein
MKQKFHVMASSMAVAISMLCGGPAHAQNTTAVPFQIVEATIDDIHMAFRSGRLTARQLVQAYLDRINAYDKQGPNINSIITINPNALAEADRLDATFRTSGLIGPMHGIAVLVKDEIDTAGMPTTPPAALRSGLASAVPPRRPALACVPGAMRPNAILARSTPGS